MLREAVNQRGLSNPARTVDRHDDRLRSSIERGASPQTTLAPVVVIYGNSPQVKSINSKRTNRVQFEQFPAPFGFSGARKSFVITHAWMAPGWQERLTLIGGSRLRSCVRPVGAVRMTAGPDGIRWSRPHHKSGNLVPVCNTGFSRPSVRPTMPSRCFTLASHFVQIPVAAD